MTRFLALAAVLFAVAGSARAAVLPFEATLTFAISHDSPATIVSTGVATLNASGGGLHLTRIAFGAGAISGTGVAPVTDPATGPITGLRVTAANLAGTIAETIGGELRGAMGLQGVMKVCLFGATPGCGAAVANVSVPLTPIGQGGSVAVGAAVNITVAGAPWTTGTAAIVTSITQMGYAHGPASGTSSTAQPGGSIGLVTPIYIRTTQGPAFIPSFATLTLHFVPEPATALLLSGGIALLCWGGRARR